jgi:hypothetical protein
MRKILYELGKSLIKVDISLQVGQHHYHLVRNHRIKLDLWLEASIFVPGSDF